MHPKYWKPHRNHFLRAPAGDDTGSQEGNSGPMDVNQAASALDAMFAADEPQQAQEAGNGETVEDAAARLAAEEAQGEGEEGEADPAAEEGDADPDPYVTIKVKGKPVTLRESEWAERHEAELRQADYTRKTMEAAEVRKAAEAQQAEARAKRDEYAGKLETFTNQTNYELNAIAAQLTDELLQTDPVAYLSMERTLRTRQAELQQAQQELQQINGQRAQESAEAERRHLESQREQLLAKVPEWKDADKFEAEAAQIKQFLTTQGYDAGELDIRDHRQILVARKAMQFDALMAKAKTATQKVAKLPTKVERPGTPEVAKPDGRTTAMKNLARTGSVNDAAAAFAQFLS